MPTVLWVAPVFGCTILFIRSNSVGMIQDSPIKDKSQTWEPQNLQFMCSSYPKKLPQAERRRLRRPTGSELEGHWHIAPLPGLGPEIWHHRRGLKIKIKFEASCLNTYRRQQIIIVYRCQKKRNKHQNQKNQF